MIGGAQAWEALTLQAGRISGMGWQKPARHFSAATAFGFSSTLF